MDTITPTFRNSSSDWNNQAIDVILHKVSKIDTVVTVQARQETMLEKLTEAVSKLAVIEDRQNSDRQLAREAAQDTKDYIVRLHERLDGHETRIDTLEKSDVDNKRVRNWAFGLVTLLAAAVIGGILKLVGLSQ